MQTNKTIIAAVFLLAVATQGLAQPGATKTIIVFARGSSVCQDASHNIIQVVLDGDERYPVTASRNNPKDPWTVKPTALDHHIKATGTRASLRLAGLRTNCATSRSHEDSGDRDGSVAFFKFDCDERPTRTLQFYTLPKQKLIPIGFVRRLTGTSLKCEDTAFLDNGPRTVDDLWSTEELRLHFGSDRDPSAPGLLVLSPTQSRALLRFSASVDRHATKRKEVREYSDLGGLIVTLIDQHAAGDGSIPHLSPNDIDVDTISLQKAGVKGLHLEIK
jgi:hypothetical protein